MLNLDRDPPCGIYLLRQRAFVFPSLQIGATFEPLSELSVTAAWRFTDVKADYTGHGLS